MNDRIAAVRAEYDRCFGCGLNNPVGLQLDGFVRKGTTVTAQFLPRPDYVGFTDVLHGGIIAAALDEIMAWTSILVENVMVVTGTLELRFRHPADANQSFLLEGTLLERRGRRLQLESKMCHDGSIVAGASGTFLAIEELPGDSGG